MIQVESDSKPLFQKSLIKQMEETMMLLQRPKIVQAPIIEQEEYSQQTMLLKEIDFFCQKLTTVKKQKPKFEDVSTKQFTCSTPDIQKLQKLAEPDELEETQQHVKFADTINDKPQQTQQNQFSQNIFSEKSNSRKTGIVKQIQPKLLIKKLQFEYEESYSWVPIQVEKQMEKELKLCINQCIFWPEEELASLKTQNINILTILESMKNINFLNCSIKELPSYLKDFAILNSQLLSQLKVYGIILSLNSIFSLRELLIRQSEIKRELLSDSLYERKKSMLLLEQKRIQKKIFLRYLEIRAKYKSAIQKIQNEVQIVRSNISSKKAFSKLYFYCQKKKEKNEFSELVFDHLRIKKLGVVMQNWVIIAQLKVKQREQQIQMKYLIRKNAFFQWHNVAKLLTAKIEQEILNQKLLNEKAEEQRKKQQDIQVNDDESDQENKILSNFLTEEKVQPYNGGPSCLNELQTLFEREHQARKVKVLVFELKEDFKQCPNLLGKAFIKWKIAFLERYRVKEFSDILQMKKLKKVFLFWKQNREYHPFYSFLLLRRSVEGFRFNQLKNKQEKLQKQLKQITLNQQRKQIEDMAIEVYQKALVKKVFESWKKLRFNEDIQLLWNSLSDQKRQQDLQILNLKFDVIQKKRKIKFFKRWIMSFLKSKKSIKNLKQCEVSAKEKAIESLIRIAFETSMKTQFKWLEYYQND